MAYGGCSGNASMIVECERVRGGVGKVGVCGGKSEKGTITRLIVSDVECGTVTGGRCDDADGMLHRRIRRGMSFNMGN